MNVTLGFTRFLLRLRLLPIIHSINQSSQSSPHAFIHHPITEDEDVDEEDEMINSDTVKPERAEGDHTHA